MAQRLTIEQYINQYYSLAVQEMNAYKIPASITLAQGLIETENGNSDLCVKANNHFGIKCKAEWTGATFIKDDDKKNECFRSYASAEESFRDHSTFLLKPRYAKLFSYDISDYKSWAYGLKEAGYATNPRYPQMLIKHIEDLQLYRFDNFGLAKNPEPIKKEEPKGSVMDEATLIKLRKEIANHLNLVIIDEKFNIYSLAASNRTSVSTLMEYNDVEGEQPFRLGQNFFLEKKHKANSRKQKHTTLIGESLYDISQIYGVSLKQLRKYNRLEAWEQPAVGEEIYLAEQRSDVIKTRPFYMVEQERVEKNLKLFIPLPTPVDAKSNAQEEKKTIASTPTNTEIVPSIPKIDSPLNIPPRDTQSLAPPQTTDPKTGKVWVNHTVRAKETIFRISKNYDCKPNEILEWNGITIEQGLQVGQILKVYTLHPNGILESPTPPQTASPPPTSSIPSKGKLTITPSEKPTVKKDTATKIINGMRVEKVSLKDLYKTVKKDSSTPTPVKSKIKLDIE